MIPVLAWGAAWAALGASLSFVVGFVHPPSLDPGQGPVDLARILGGVGALCGLVYGVLLALLEPRKALHQVPLFRAVLWGSFAGTVPPLLLTGIDNSVMMNTCPLSAISALTTVLAARAMLRPARMRSKP